MADRNRLLVVGWDAATWRTLRPLVNSGQLPCLAELIAQGESGVLESVAPLVDAAMWTTAMTGVDATRHDVFTDLEPDFEGSVRPTASSSRRWPAVWQTLSAHGIQCIVSGVPVTHPAESIAGVIASERLVEAHSTAADYFPPEAGSAFPEHRQDELLELSVRPRDILPEDLTPFFPGGVDLATAPATLATILAQLATAHNIATQLLERERGWQLAVFRYRALASVCHAFFGGVSTAETRPLGKHIWVAMCSLLDQMLARLVELAGPGAAVLLFSPCAFRPRRAFQADAMEAGHNKHLAPQRIFEPTEWHGTRGMFALAGDKHRGRSQARRGSLLDIAPTILEHFGLRQASELPGRALQPSANQGAREKSTSVNASIPRPSHLPDPWFDQQLRDLLSSVGAIPARYAEAPAVELAIVRRHVYRGELLFQLGRLADAEAEYRQLAERDGSVATLAHIARCLLAANRIELADEWIARVETRSRQPVLGIALRASWHMLRREHAAAIKLLRGYVQREDAPRVLVEQFGFALTANGELDDAIGAFDRALQQNEASAQAHAGLAECYSRLGERSKSLFHKMRYYELQPGNRE